MNIIEGNFTEKDKLIAQFYTLRAGLSAISDETDKIKRLETEIEETKYVAQYVYDVGAVNCFVSNGSGGVLTSVANVNG